MVPDNSSFRYIKLKSVSLGAYFIFWTILFFCSNGLAADFVSVNKDGVNLRSGPDIKSDILYELPKGYPLKVIEKKNGWFKVSDYENDRGWIYSSLISNDRYVIVKAKEANMRSGPGTNYKIVGEVYREVVLKKISVQNKWVKVSHPLLPGGKAWIYQNLIWP